MAPPVPLEIEALVDGSDSGALRTTIAELRDNAFFIRPIERRDASPPERPEAILSALVQDILQLPALVTDATWDSYSTVAEVGDGTVGVSAFRYGAGTRPIPSPAVRDVGAFARLRDSMRVGDAEPWTVCIVKVERSTARVAVNFVDAEYAGLWHVAPETYDRVAEALRPQAADFFTATLDRNESGPPSVVEPVLVVEVHADGGLRLTTPKGSGPATSATLRGALLDAATRGTGVVVNGDVDAPLAQPIVAEARRTVPTVEVVPTDPQQWPHRWSSVQLTAAGGLTAELQDLLARALRSAPVEDPRRTAWRCGTAMSRPSSPCAPRTRRCRPGRRRRRRCRPPSCCAPTCRHGRGGW